MHSIRNVSQICHLIPDAEFMLTNGIGLHVYYSWFVQAKTFKVFLSIEMLR